MKKIEKLEGRAVLPDEVTHATISIHNEVIHRIDTSSRVEEELLIFPGFFDIHVHAREFPIPDRADEKTLLNHQKACAKETFKTAGLAAVHGGITRYAAMPNDFIPPNNSESYERKRILSKSSLCPVIPLAVISKNSRPWADVPYKVYLDKAGPDWVFTNWHDLEETLKRFANCRVFFHAEDPEILRKLSGIGHRWQTRPRDAEIRAVNSILDLTSKFNIRTHFCHISCRDAVDSIAEFNRASDSQVTSEATPHHLFFSIHDGKVQAALPGMTTSAAFMGSNPPLRSEEDRQFLLHALKTGVIDVLASDHAPHTLEDKMEGAPGVPHLDTMGPFIGWLIQDCGFPETRIAEIASENPAKLFQADSAVRFGRIEKSWEATFSILRLNGTAKIQNNDRSSAARLRTKCGWSPFAGITFPAFVEKVIIKGLEFHDEHETKMV
jgi:dihydroorotase